MEKWWDYKVILLGYGLEIVESKLKVLGEKGWELVSVLMYGNGEAYAIFKIERERKKEIPELKTIDNITF